MGNTLGYTVSNTVSRTVCYTIGNTIGYTVNNTRVNILSSTVSNTQKLSGKTSRDGLFRKISHVRKSIRGKRVDLHHAELQVILCHCRSSVYFSS